MSQYHIPIPTNDEVSASVAATPASIAATTTKIPLLNKTRRTRLETTDTTNSTMTMTSTTSNSSNCSNDYDHDVNDNNNNNENDIVDDDLEHVKFNDNNISHMDDQPSNTITSQTTTTSSTMVTAHVVILVHGFIGCAQDLGYIHHAVKEQATIVQQQLSQERQRQRDDHDHSVNDNDIKRDDPNDNFEEEETKDDESFYVYLCRSNEGRTNDGIQAGGDRIAAEVRQYLQDVVVAHEQEKQHNNQLQEITISIIGYSLGGLYGRYALPKILQPLEASTTTPSIVLTPKVFCTIATPHLGSAGHTYVPFPKPLQTIFGWFSRTGRDLFHHTDIIHQTVTDPYWVEPLLSFQRRIAYANTYESDIMVPTSTAAFLSPNSPEQHYIVEQRQQQQQSTTTDDNDKNNNKNGTNPFVVLVVETPAEHDALREQLVRDQDTEYWSPLSKAWDDHSRRLDAMGWSKVFVDFNTTDNTATNATTTPSQVSPTVSNDADNHHHDDTSTNISSPFKKIQHHHNNKKKKILDPIESMVQEQEKRQQQAFYDSPYFSDDDHNDKSDEEIENNPEVTNNLLSHDEHNNDDDSSHGRGHRPAPRRRSFQSAELHAEFNRNKQVIKPLFPNGHDQIAVNSKNMLYSYTLRKGRPMIDQLANEFVRDILVGSSHQQQQPSSTSGAKSFHRMTSLPTFSSPSLLLSSSSSSSAQQRQRPRTNCRAAAPQEGKRKSWSVTMGSNRPRPPPSSSLC